MKKGVGEAAAGVAGAIYTTAKSTKKTAVNVASNVQSVVSSVKKSVSVANTNAVKGGSTTSRPTWRQSVMIDVRGQNVSDSILNTLYDDIVKRTGNGVEILFKMK